MHISDGDASSATLSSQEDNLNKSRQVFYVSYILVYT